jgi:hypothetical protein
MDNIKHIGCLFVEDDGKQEIVRVYYKGERVNLNDIRVEWIESRWWNDEDYKLNEGTIIDYGNYCEEKGLVEGEMGDDL